MTNGQMILKLKNATFSQVMQWSTEAHLEGDHFLAKSLHEYANKKQVA